MQQATYRKFKKEHAWGPCILTAGVLGIIFSLMTAPSQFPAVWLYLAGLGSVISIVVPQNS